ncbi:Hsp70 family protein [Dactylosporangium sp. CA-139066]|uniref:Hsp70 family protein n=1 Tax=Dactylosporangium sp. CA-139066 TaxID=3239930 RepID=UPI003D92467A
MAEHELGIDFGTSNTVAVLRRADGVVAPLLFDSSPLLASGVFAGAEGGLLTGADAERAAAAHPGGFEGNPKRRIDDGTVWLGERELPVRDVVAAVLDRVAGEARRTTGTDPASVVLTHPVAWSRTRLAMLADAADAAGLGAVRFVPEPVAAAAYFAGVLNHRLPIGEHVVVYDLGAGTFDVSVVRRTEAGFDVVAGDGLPDIGGLDLDAAVVAHARTLTAAAADEWGRLDWPQTPSDQRDRRTLWLGARAAKEQLSRHSTADLHVPLIDTLLHVTREEFEAAARPHLEPTVALTVATLRAAAVPAERIAGVFLVGGSSRIPLAASLLHRTLRIAPTAIDTPELVVAWGSLSSPTAAGPTLPPPSPPAPAPAGPAFPAPSTAPMLPPPPPVQPAPAPFPTGPAFPAPSTAAVSAAPLTTAMPVSAVPDAPVSPPVPLAAVSPPVPLTPLWPEPVPAPALGPPGSIRTASVLLWVVAGLLWLLALIAVIVLVAGGSIVASVVISLLALVALGGLDALCAVRLRRGRRDAGVVVYVLTALTIAASVVVPLTGITMIFMIVASVAVTRRSARAWLYR